MKGIDVATVEDKAMEATGRVTEMANDLRLRAEAAQQDLRRNLRKAKAKADDLLEEGRHEIKTHPLSAVAAFAGAGLLIGFVAGMVLGRRKR